MDKIKAEYTDASDLIRDIGKERLKRRIKYFMESMNAYIQSLDDKFQQQLAVNDKILEHCVLDYFYDIHRLKSFHQIEKINDIKRVAYESYWILRRKPIQVTSADIDDDALVYANEKYVLVYLIDELIRGKRDDILNDESSVYFNSFANSLYYHLKYRDCDAKVLELMILAFKAGLNYNLQIKEEPSENLCD